MSFSDEDALLSALMHYEKRCVDIIIQLEKWSQTEEKGFADKVIDARTQWTARGWLTAKQRERVAFVICRLITKAEEAAFAMRDELYGATGIWVSFNSLTDYTPCICCEGRHITATVAAKLHGVVRAAYGNSRPKRTIQGTAPAGFRTATSVLFAQTAH